MAEDFLEYIDELHKAYRMKNKIKNKYYIHYLPLKSITISTNEVFYIAKSGKSRLLINHNAVWVDLTDYDIINIVCGFDEKLVLKILDRLKECYDGIWTEFEFEVQEERYIGKGINYEDFDLDMKVCLDSDFQICFGDFLFLLNMVLFKDIVGQKYLEKERKMLLIDNTLIKYITLIKYYRLNNAQAKKYLDGILYPYLKKQDLLENKMKVKKYDKNFDKNGFEKNVLL